MHVGLINPFDLTIAPLDTAATAAVDPPGTPDSGYDDVFREPRVWNTPGTETKETARREGTPYIVRAQVEVGPWNDAQRAELGDDPRFELVAVADLYLLKRDGFLDADGRPNIHRGDRLVEIRRTNGDLARTFNSDETMYVMGVKESEYGIGLTRNLLFITFGRRRRTVAA